MADKKEMVNHPLHYGGDTPYEVIKVLRAWMTPEAFRGWLLGTIIKYLPRADKKGDQLEDFKKARWYLDYLIKELEEVTEVPSSIDRDSISRHLWVVTSAIDPDDRMLDKCHFCNLTRGQFIATAYPVCGRKYETEEVRDHS